MCILKSAGESTNPCETPQGQLAIAETLLKNCWKFYLDLPVEFYSRENCLSKAISIYLVPDVRKFLE